MRPAPAKVGDPLSQVDTPALIVDLDAFERNLDRMAEALKGSGAKLRPHVKTHKSPTIARMQVELGAVGVCAQTLGEAEVMVDGGITDVLITNQIVQPGKIDRLISLSKRAQVHVCVDDPENVRRLAEAARSAGVVLSLLVEVDIGQGRCGTDPCEPTLDLAHLVAETPGVRFSGLHAYQGKNQHIYNPEDRAAANGRAINLTRETVALLSKNGLTCEIVSGAGTGTFPLEASSGVYNEVQAGSYVFMDADYARVGGMVPMFETALFVLTTVLSRRPGRAVCDAGLKASSTDCGLPSVKDRPGISYVGISDEHGNLVLTDDSVNLGDQLLLIPGHCDPTVNLHDWYVCIRDGKVEAVWEVVGRGR